MSKYLKQLSADLPGWVKAGHVSESGAASILREVEARAGQGWFRLPLMLSMLGGILVFAGIISLVAANWDDIPRLTKVALLVLAMGLSLGGAHMARQRGAEGPAHGFAFLGALIFGANIMLIGQIYHLPPNPPGGALFWALGASVVALLWPSQLVMALALFLTGMWTWFAHAAGMREIAIAFFASDAASPHLPFLLLWAPLVVISIKQGWNKAVHMGALVLAFWLYHSMISVLGRDAMSLSGLVFVGCLFAFAVAGRFLQVANYGAGVLSRYIWIMFMFWLLLSSWEEVRYIDSLFITRADVAYTGSQVALLIAIALVGVLGLVGVVRNVLRPVAAAAVAAAAFPLLANLLVHADSAAGGFAIYVVMSLLVVAIALTSIMHGYQSGQVLFINLGFVLFSLKAIWLYFETVMGLEAKSLMFIIGGVLTIILSITVDRQRRKLLGEIKARS